jgi:hypothetical protein
MNPRRLFVVCARAGMMMMPAPALAQLRAQPYVSGLSFPVAFIPDPTRPGRHFVVEQMGHVRVVVDGVLQDRDFLAVIVARVAQRAEVFGNLREQRLRRCNGASQMRVRFPAQ